ncbi:hypothetical protein Pcinc_041566, partial [Petrolisthes cinctipes]
MEMGSLEKAAGESLAPWLEEDVCRSAVGKMTPPLLGNLVHDVTTRTSNVNEGGCREGKGDNVVEINKQTRSTKDLG